MGAMPNLNARIMTVDKSRAVSASIPIAPRVPFGISQCICILGLSRLRLRNRLTYRFRYLVALFVVNLTRLGWRTI